VWTDPGNSFDRAETRRGETFSSKSMEADSGRFRYLSPGRAPGLFRRLRVRGDKEFWVLFVRNVARLVYIVSPGATCHDHPPMISSPRPSGLPLVGNRLGVRAHVSLDRSWPLFGLVTPQR
jgi:hypothetical protein